MKTWNVFCGGKACRVEVATSGDIDHYDVRPGSVLALGLGFGARSVRIPGAGPVDRQLERLGLPAGLLRRAVIRTSAHRRDMIADDPGMSRKLDSGLT